MPESSGKAIEPQVKDAMEKSFGADLSKVRIHKDAPASETMGARAYTNGANIYFAPGQYAPDTQVGKQLLGHELTHVVQQRQGTIKPDGIARAEASLAGHAVAGGMKAHLK